MSRSASDRLSMECGTPDPRARIMMPVAAVKSRRQAAFVFDLARAIAAIMVFGLLMGAPVCSPLLGSSPPSVDARTAMYPLHDPIVISDDSEFTSENGVVSGSGNESDPYIIENWEIALDAASEASAGILISGTESHFVVRDAYIHGELYSGDGIRLEGRSESVSSSTAS